MDEEEEKLKGEKSEKKNGRLKRSLIIALAATGLSVTAIIAAKKGYDAAFKRYERPDYSITAGECCYERVDGLVREERSFYSDAVRLQGYYYPCDNAKGLVVFCHGLHAGADDYLSIYRYVVECGYAVFSFDWKGTYSSEGDSTVGMCEALVDLDHALDYVSSCRDFAGMPIFLIGHSMGGYAAASVLALHSEVKSCAAIAAPNSGYSLILEKGEQYAGKLAGGSIPKTFLDCYQKILFGNYICYNGVVGINSTDIPVLVAHGNSDETIEYSSQSIIAHRGEIREDNVFYYTAEGALGKHNTILHSAESVAYQGEVNAKIKQLKADGASYEELKAYVASVDHALYSAVNEDLFSKIIEMFDGTL